MKDFASIGRAFMALLVVVGVVFAPIASAGLAIGDFTAISVAGTLMLYAVLVFLAYWIIAQPARHFIEWNLGFAALSWYGTSVVVALVGIVAISNGYAFTRFYWVNDALVALAIAILIIVGGCMVVWLEFTAIVRVWVQVARLRSPASAITSALVDVLLQAEALRGRSLRFRTRNYILARLEESARAFETGLPRVIRAGDASTSSWCRGVGKGLAARMRSEKKIFALGVLSSDDDLSKRFTAYLSAAIVGNWLSIERLEPEKQSRQQRVQRIARFLEGGVIAVIPGLTLWGLWDRLGLQSPFSEYVKVGALVWGVAALALSWDPTFAARLLSLKGLAGSIASKE